MVIPAPEHPDILLVEESPADRALVTRLLRGRLAVAADAEAALDAVRRRSFTAILLAQALPRQSGLDLLRELRASGDTTPVVLLTEADDEAATQRALQAGATACVVKRPGFESDLLAFLDRAARRTMPSPQPPRVRSDARIARDVLVVEIAGQRHGILASAVETIVRAVAISPLPSAPTEVEGCVEYRGRVVPVLALHARLGLPPKPVEADEHLVLAWAGGRLVAIRVDRAVALAHVEAHELVDDEIPELLAGSVASVARLPDGPVFVHALTTFVESSEPAPRGRPIRGEP